MKRLTKNEEIELRALHPLIEDIRNFYFSKEEDEDGRKRCKVLSE